MSIKDTVLASSPDLTHIIKKAVERIGENHSLARDNEGITMSSQEIEKDRKEWRESDIIEESLKAVALEMAEKMVLENTIDGMVKSTIKQMGGGSGFKTPQGGSNTLKKFATRQEVGEQDDINNPGGHKSFTSLGPVGFPIQLAKDLFKELPTDLQGKIKNILRGGAVDKVVIEMKEMCKDVGGTWNACDEKRSPITGNPLESTCWCTNKEGNKITPWINKYQGIFNQKVQAILDKMGKEFEKLPNTQDGWDSLIGLKEGAAMSESTTDTIKKLVRKKLKEANNGTPGIDAYKKAFKESGKENETYHKEFKKKFDKYGDFENNSHPEFPHQNNSKTDYKSPMYRGTTEDEEFVDDFAYPGLQDFDIHNQDMERLTDYLEGSSETGNAMTDSDDKALGNVVPDELGKKVLKSIKRRKEKIAAEKASMSNLRGYTPDVQKVKQIKESINSDIDKMKNLLGYNKITQ